MIILRNFKFKKSKALLLGFIFLLFSTLLLVATPSLSTPPKNRQAHHPPPKILIKHAQTYFWLGIAEKGNLQAFSRGEAYLRQAEKKLARTSLPDPEKKVLAKEIKSLRDDFKEQREVHHDTFYGVFPYVRFFSPSLFRDAMGLGTFELIDDPKVMACTSAATTCTEKTLYNWTTHPQLNVIFNSYPHDPALEQEVLYVFNNSAIFFAHNRSELARYLEVSELENLQNSGNELPETIINKLCTAFASKNFLLVSIVKKDQVDNNFFYILESRLFSSGHPLPTYNFSNMGFSRKRNHLLPWVILINILYLVLAIAGYRMVFLFHEHKQLSNRRQLFSKEIFRSGSLPLATPITAFILGRISPWLLAPLLKQVAPPPETLALVSFWWPLFFVIVIFIIPFFLYQNIFHFFLKHLDNFFFNHQGGNIAVACAAGTCAYLATPFILYLTPAAAACRITFLTIFAFISMYHLGETLESHAAHPPKWNTWHTIFLCLALFVFLLALLSNWEAICFVAVALGAMLTGKILLPHLHKEKTGTRQSDTPDTDSHLLPKSLEELKRQTLNPTDYYIKSPDFEKFIRDLPKEHGSCIYLTGPEGSGKTIAAKSLTIAIESDPKMRADFNGECPHNSSTSNIRQYDVFLKMFSILKKQIILSPLEQIMPFGNIFSILDRELTPEELEENYCEKIKRYLEKEAEDKTVFMRIDNIQWMDSGSRNLLTKLLQKINFSENKIYIILTSRTARKSCLDIPPEVRLDEKEIKSNPTSELLHDFYGFSKDSSKQIFQIFKDNIGKTRHNTIRDYFSYIRQLVENDFIRKDDNNCFIIKPSEKKLPLPEGYKKEIQGTVARLDTTCKETLIYAALLGYHVDAHILLALRAGKLDDCLDVLATNEIIYDDLEQDGYYSFTNQWVFETVKEACDITYTEPPGWKGCPESIKRKHFEIAENYAKLSEDDPEKVFAAALHFSSSGKQYVNKAFTWSRRAINLATSQYDFDKAQQFIGLCAKCAEPAQEEFNPELECLILECRKAFVTNKDNIFVAEKCLKYVDNLPGKALQNIQKNILTTFIVIFYEAWRNLHNNGNNNDLIKFLNAGTNCIRILQQSENNNLIIAEAMFYKGLFCSNDNEALEAYNNALKLLEQHHDKQDRHLKELRSWILDRMARIKTLGHQKRKKCASESIDLKRELKDEAGLSRTLGIRGVIHTEEGDFDEARKDLVESRTLANRLGDVWGEYLRHSELGACLMKEAENTKNIDEGKLSSAMESYKKAWQVIDKFPPPEQPQLRQDTLYKLLLCSQKMQNWNTFCQWANETETKELPESKGDNGKLERIKELIDNAIKAGHICNQGTKALKPVEKDNES